MPQTGASCGVAAVVPVMPFRREGGVEGGIGKYALIWTGQSNIVIKQLLSEQIYIHMRYMYA